MKQLVQLQKRAEDFKALNAEMLFVYREESEGVEGLKKIKDKQKTTYRLSVDLNKKASGAYSPEANTYHNYVVDSNGIVRGIIEGTKSDRATAEELIEVLKQIKVKAE